MIDDKNRILNLVVAALHRKNLYDTKHRERLKEELKQIEIQEEFLYFLDLYDKKIKYSYNEHNSIVPYLLDIMPDFDIDREVAYAWGDWPDVDIDYLPQIQQYLKNEWAPNYFGKENVCSIGNYSTFGIKSALIDMTRVHSGDRQTILDLTTKLDNKDDDGKPITLEKAIESNPGLAEFCKANPAITDAAKNLVNRNRGRGKHAGGLIISRIPIDELVPLVVDKDGMPVSAWTEGLHSTDLGPMGFIKYDILVVTNLMQIAKCVKFVKERHGLAAVCNLPDLNDWSDTSYLEDPLAIKIANEGKLKCVFQFDSPGIRDMVKQGGVTGFDDLMAYTSLWRPSALDAGMHTHYINRKKDIESYEIHPLLKPIIGRTYGVMCYQEQVMKILNVVGDIPLIHCEKVRKAISKKKEEVFEKYKVQFIENGQKNLQWSKEQVEDLWKQVVAFSGYGFCMGHACAYTYISSRLLYLKAHYPIEFFAAVLSCESDGDKIRDYKVEAEKNNINICPVDINKSKETFDILDEKIYIGFSNIKGIGSEPAKRIVAGQPYVAFEDFLHKFGTDASVLKPLLALRIFKDLNGAPSDPALLWEFAEYYKSEIKRRQDRKKRHLASCEVKIEELRQFHQEMTVDNHGIKQLKKKYKELRCKFLEKVANDKPILFSDFNPIGKIDCVAKAIFDDKAEAIENKYYGFGWTHELLSNPDCEGYTFERFKDSVEKEDTAVWLVEVRVVDKPKEIMSKKNNVYYSVKVEDAEWHQEYVKIWQDDWERWKEEFSFWDEGLNCGNLLKIRLKHTIFNGRSSYSFDAPKKQDRYKLPSKEDDFRLTVMKRV